MKKLFLTLLAAASLLLAANVPAQPIAPAATPGIAAKLIVRGDLMGLQVVDLRSQMRNDVMAVQAEVYNFSDRDARLYYRFRWIDSGGMQVGDGEVWKPMLFLGQQTQYLRGTAPSPKVADFMIEMSASPR
jgi:uncharacterized protein YcfL